eukprot:3730747-Amphidinium_carterae.1
MGSEWRLMLRTYTSTYSRWREPIDNKVHALGSSGMPPLDDVVYMQPFQALLQFIVPTKLRVRVRQEVNFNMDSIDMGLWRESAR